MIDIDNREDQSSSERVSTRMKSQRRRPDHPSDLDASAERKKTAGGARTAAELTSFFRWPLKFEDVTDKVTI